ncbi:hypothetical protein [Mycobacterium shimoidei]|nr:hypothetical protein [Mycobacterium shimoidei]
MAVRQGVDVGVALKPWEQIMADVADVATITRAESLARRGLPVIDADIVPIDPPESRADVDAPMRTPADAPDAPTAATATPTRQLEPLDDATADAGQANRANAARQAKAKRVSVSHSRRSPRPQG